MSRFVDENSFGLYAGPEHLDFIRIAGRRVHVHVMRRFRCRHSGEVYVYLVRSFHSGLVRSRISLTPVVVENDVHLSDEKKLKKLIPVIVITVVRSHRFGFSSGVFYRHVHRPFARRKRLDGKLRFGSYARTGRFDSGTVHANAKKCTVITYFVKNRTLNALFFFNRPVRVITSDF